MPDSKLEVRVYPTPEGSGSLKAYASVSVDDLIAIRGICVLDGKNGLFVSMPQSKDKEGVYHDIAFPLNADLRAQINQAVLNGYATALDRKPLAEGIREGVEKQMPSLHPAEVMVAKRLRDNQTGVLVGYY